MRKIVKWSGRLILLLALAAVAVGIWKREEITRLMAVNTLFQPDRIVQNFSQMNAAFLNTPVPRGNGPTTPLPYGPEYDLPEALQPWISERNLTALLILKDGAVVYENYFQGTTPEDKRISWSVAKSYLSALIGILIDEGAIASLDDPVTTYAPSLKDGAYDRTTIRNVLNMASGVTFDENFQDKNSDINRMSRTLALGGKMDDFASALDETFAAPGVTWKYVSIDTHVLSMVVRGAAGRSIPELMSEKLIAPMGLEYEPYYLTDGVGTAFVLGGLNLTARDYARFGQMFLQNGRYNGQQIVPEAWVRLSTAASAPTAAGKNKYGLHWWIPKDSSGDTFYAQGLYGQYIWVDRARNVVIVVNAADHKFNDAGVNDRNMEIFRQISNDLSGE